MQANEFSQPSGRYALVAIENARERFLDWIANSFPYCHDRDRCLHKKCSGVIRAKSALPVRETDAYARTKESAEVPRAEVS
jgi:hypothetical protein